LKMAATLSRQWKTCTFLMPCVGHMHFAVKMELLDLLLAQRSLNTVSSDQQETALQPAKKRKLGKFFDGILETDGSEGLS